MVKRKILIFAVLVCWLAGGAIGAQENSDSARNIFDSQVGQKSDSSTQVKARSEVPERPKSNQTVTKTGPVAKTVVRQPRNQTPAKASAPIALKYSVALLGQEGPKGYAPSRALGKVLPQEDGKFYGVADPDQNFHLGDVIRLVFEPSHPGYLYVFSIETDGSRNLLFPEPGKAAYVKGDAPVLIGPFRVEPPAGTDKLTVLLSRERVPAFEENSKNLAQEFESLLVDHNYQTIEEEEIHIDSKRKTALYFASQGNDGLKAEIDIKHQ
jgi:hypothetical protein